MIPPLCIIQARYHSTRLPGKMLLTLPSNTWPPTVSPACVIGRKTPILRSETMIARAVRLATEAFGTHVRVAIPLADLTSKLGDELIRIDAKIMTWDGPEWDVLGRVLHIARALRWHPDAVIHRWTPDDPFKNPVACREVAEGARHAVELGGEAWTLAMLEQMDADRPANADGSPTPSREHFGSHLRLGEPGLTVDTQDDYEEAWQRAADECMADCHGVRAQRIGSPAHKEGWTP